MIYTEEKAKVVATDWETEFIQSLATLAILHQDDIKKRMMWRKGWLAQGGYEETDEFILFFKSSWCKTASAARNLINSVPPKQRMRRPLPALLFCINPSSMRPQLPQLETCVQPVPAASAVYFSRFFLRDLFSFLCALSLFLFLMKNEMSNKNTNVKLYRVNSFTA